MTNIYIPKCMSTQHPDNVHSPFFAQDSILGGEDEITEAYYAFSHLLCDEQMWDCEGKETDNYVVKKLLTKYEEFFRKNVIGEQAFITLRVPNPDVEKTEAKILFETLESIPRSFDVSKLFYQKEKAPVFEVILPMASSAQSINRIYQYYKNFVAGKQSKPCFEGDISIGKWIGEFKPITVNVIPLFEDKDNALNSHNILAEYLKDKEVDYQRVFFARSDPAMNYGMINALLLNKLSLYNIYQKSKEIGIPFFPILGAGSAPLRGHLTPLNVDDILKEYPSVHTFSVQSAFKYDYPVEQVRQGIKTLLNAQTTEPHFIDEKKATDIIFRMEKAFQAQIKELAPAINLVAKYIPKRRRRKLHVGLFGYSRDVGGVTLPRAITFTASLYSLGVPPELLGINVLTDEDIAYIKTVYVNFDKDLAAALTFHNPDSPFFPKEVLDKLSSLKIDYNLNEAHKNYTDNIVNAVQSQQNLNTIPDFILKAGNLRKFLG